MQEHRNSISSLQIIDFGPNSTLQAKKCRNIKLLSVCFCKLILGQIPYSKQRNAGTSNLYHFPPKYCFWAKFHITNQGMQEHRTFISLLQTIEFGPNTTLQARECKNIEILSVSSQKLIFGQIPHRKQSDSGIANLYQFAPQN